MLKSKSLLIILLLILVLPTFVYAEKVEYQTTNLPETLEKENIEKSFKDYKETDDQITIYMFRGTGCGFCAKFLTYLSSITDEYGKYFKLKAYEVWNDQNNSQLFQNVATFLGKQANGVPFVIIGDQVFEGYTESYNDAIKKAITDLYNTNKKKRYDVLVELEKAEKNKSKGDGSVTDVNKIIMCNLLFTIISTATIIVYVNVKLNKINK